MMVNDILDKVESFVIEIPATSILLSRRIHFVNSMVRLVAILLLKVE